MRILSLAVLALLPLVLSCRKAPINPVHCNISNTNNNYFEIQSNEDPPDRAFNIFCKKVDVFGIILYGTPTVSDEKILHAANVMAQYLDNDEDGVADDPLIVNALVSRNSFMAMAKNEKELKKFFNSYPPNDMKGQDLYAEETVPASSSEDRFDATLEEVLHLITSVGYANVYPGIWGEQSGSAVSNAMDKARGGYFTSIPSSYPGTAWYHYDDATCEYNCMVTEYVYWAVTSLMGAQNYGKRCQEIVHEWELCTPEEVKNGDPSIYSLITDSIHGMPLILPDGSYRK